MGADDREALASRQAKLSPAKQAILARWKRGAVTSPAAPSRIPRRADPGTARLSFAQERLWFLDQLAPGNPAYNLAPLVRLCGPLDVAAMQRAFVEIVRRHEILRTAFTTRDEQPIQTILPRLEVPLPLVDLVRCPPRAAREEADRRIRDAARRSFDLRHPPLLRPLIVRLGREEHLLLVSFHHIIFDGWSVGILVREVGSLYDAFRAGRAASLPPLPVQYGDFGEWQRRWLRGEVLEKQLAYWTRQLAGPPPVLELPTDRTRPAVARQRGARVPVGLRPEPAAALTQFSRGRETTLFMTLLGAFAVLLGRFAGQLDLCIGSPVANRNQTEIEALIGFFVNSLALRIDLRGDPSFTTLLAQIRQVTLEAYANQDLPFAVLVEKLAPQRNLSHSPLFQVMFVLQNAPSEILRTTELALEPLDLDDGTAKFDLLLILTERDRGVSGFLEYDRDLFEHTTICRLAGHFRALATGLTADPTLRLSELPLLSAAERQQLWVEWNDTVVACPHQGTIHQLFEQQVRKRPQAVAVVFGRSQLTYRELNRRADQLAHSLRQQGVGPEVCVGLCVERSPEMVVAILGILKAGGAYVPLDPGYPAERLEFMVEQVQASVLVTQQRLLAQRLPPGFGGALRRCCLDREPAAMAECGAENPSSGARPENLANVMFTSGSTGRPKGVAVVHRAVVRLVRGANYAALDAGEVFLQFAPISFDASTLELWGPLLNGGRLVVFPPEVPSPWELGEVVARHAVSTLWLTAGLFHQMVDENLAALRGVRQLLAGGDVLSPHHVRRALEELPECRLINGYGPTENTTFSCCCPVRTAAEAVDSVAIGRPISGSRAHVLNRQLQPVGVGVYGELYVAGHGLARGYLNRPGRTAESFVPCPMEGDPGTRLYRTGDLARHLPDGRIEFLGRRDHQIKMRGFRIELGEIEAALLRHPAVREALVVAREEAAGTDKYLAAYVVSHQAPPPTLAELREFLAATLTEYMVPSAIVFLEALPLLPSGKVDRRALPAPDAERPELGPPFAAPRTPIEELLATIWCDVLDLDRVGIDDSFFDLGGHSLLATQLLSRIRKTFQVELPLRQVFQTPTVATLAPAVAAAGSGEPAPPLAPVPRDEDFRRGVPLSFAQQRLWVLDQLAPGDPAYNVPVAVRLRGEADVPALAASLSEITRRHEALRTRFATVDGKAVQVIAPVLALPLPEVDLRALEPAARERAAERLAGEQARRPFALSRLPLLRAALLRLAADEVIVVLNAHHVVTDGWSMGVLIRELAALYGAFRERRAASLPELGIQYADFALWQRQWLQGAVLDRHLAFWTKQLADPPAALTLPRDRPRPGVWSSAGALFHFPLPEGLEARLQSFGREHDATLFMTLLAALVTLLGRYTGQEDVCIGAPIAHRHHSEIEGLIGFFVNTLVMRTDLAGDPSFQGLLSRVRQVALDAYAHQDLPFELLVDALDPDRDLSRTPLFQVALVVQNFPLPRCELTGLTLEPRVVPNHTTKFDLSLFFTTTPGGLTGAVEYTTALFDPTTIHRFAGHLRTLLQGAVTAAERRLSELPLVPAAERHQLRCEWNDTAADYGEKRCLHELIAARAAQRPEAPAVVYEGAILSYRELDRRAGRLAATLRRRGVGPDVPVGVFMERSLELVVALVAVLKAGGAYLPLDPSYPKERLAFMVEDAQVPVLLTQPRLKTRAPAGGAEVLDVDSALTAPAADGAPSSVTRPENLAYAIYTSGSTGQPKGTLVSHRAIVNRLLWGQDLYALTPGEAVMQKTPFSFDVSVWEFFWPLIAGARLVVARPGGHQDGAYLAELILRERVTTIHFVPSMLQVFAAEPRLSECRSLRRVIASGEALPRELAERFYARSQAVLHNLYGPTEAAVEVTFWRCERGGRQSVPIGRPIANLGMHVLDRRGRPVAAGAVGELHIAGVGLARGYLRRPGLTAERFVPDPFAGGGARLYRTGDRARFRPDGAIEFLGRIDRQVKVRGFRIEIGEIEARLAAHPAIREVVVSARRQEETGGLQLVAWVVGSEPPTVGELRDFLRERLPEYMVPAIFVPLEALPLLPNGKVDHRRLPAPEPSRPELGQACVAPATPQEKLLAQIWTHLLPVDEVGVHDNFFELGGDSILGIQVVARAQEAGLRLVPRDLFRHQTIAELAAMAGTAPAAAAEQGVVTGPVPLSPIQCWFFERGLPAPGHFNQAVLLALRGRLERPLLARTLVRLRRHHDALRLRFRREESGWRQVNAGDRGALPLVTIDLTALAEPHRQLPAAAAQLHGSLDLARGPLWRMALFDLGPEEAGRLLWVIHHLAVDGVSWRVLLQDLERVYGQLERGDEVSLPAKTESFKRWAERLREHARSDALGEDLLYWSAPPRTRVGPLPVDFSGGLNTVASAREVAVELGTEATRSLLQEAPAAYHTQINDLLLAALAHAFAEWTGQLALLVDLEGHGREELFEGVDLSRTVGWFTVLYPVLLDLGEAWGPGEELVAIKEQLRAVPHGGIGYGLLRYLRADDEIAERLAGLPEAEVVVNYLGQLDAALSQSQRFALAPEDGGPAHGRGGRRRHLLEINGGVLGGRLRFRFTYSENLHRRSTVEALATGFLEALRLFIDHCLSPTAGGYSPADFPEARLGQQDLDELFSQLENGGRGQIPSPGRQPTETT